MLQPGIDPHKRAAGLSTATVDGRPLRDASLPTHPRAHGAVRRTGPYVPASPIESLSRRWAR